MTLVLNVPTELETKLEEEADRRGTRIEDVAIELLAASLRPDAQHLPERRPVTDRKRRALPPRGETAMGRYAGILPSSDDFIREKRLETAREDARFQ